MSFVFRVLSNRTNLITRFFCVAFFAFVFSLFLQGQEPKVIQIINADEAVYDEAISKDAQILKGNVHLVHNEVKLWCDSAYLFQGTNILKAFSNVKMNQGDSILLSSNYLEYNGNKRLANAIGDISLDEKEFHLSTPSILYDLNTKRAKYTQQGVITSKENDNKLTSDIGIYNSESKLFFFKKNVVLNNPQYVVNTDTMDYNTQSEIAYFFGPTEITSDSNFLYCENGFYDTQNNVSAFKKNSYLVSKSQKLAGDSLHYDRNKGVGRAFRNIVMTDTANEFQILGQYAIYFEKTDSSLITQKPKLIKFFEEDSLYLKADTVYTVKDSNDVKQVFAFHNVRFFKTDIQGVCDTLFFTQNDSTLTMIQEPILWHNKDQITGEKIVIYADSSEVKKLYINKRAMIVEEAGSNIFNQVKGKEMWSYFRENELYKTDINGNGETVYYAFDEGTEPPKLTGINKAYCSNMQIRFKDREISSINFKVKPQSTMYPPKQVGSELFVLKDFKWLQDLRPLSATEILLDLPSQQSASSTYPLEEQSNAN